MAKLINKLIDEVVNEAQKKVVWPDVFVNKETGREYKPHNEDCIFYVKNDMPRYMLARGGESSGKSVLLIMKILYKLRRGCNGIVVSPTLPAFKRALFPELMRWLPQEVVIPQHRRFFSPGWKPHTGFDIVVYNEIGGYSTLTCASAENPITLEGPNLNFCGMEEIRGMSTSLPVKVLSGRVRIPVKYKKENIPPQLFIASTSRDHWMYDMFGPEKAEEEVDDYRKLKRELFTIRVKTEDNVRAGNIDKNYISGRGATLTEAEKRVLLDGEWGAEDTSNAFLDSIIMWDSLKTDIAPLKKKNDKGNNWSDVLILGVDGAVSRDYFAIVGVTRYTKDREKVAVRFSKVWKPKRGRKIDFLGTPENKGPELFIREICENFKCVCLVYDDFQLHDMMTRLQRDGIVWTRVFNQHKPRSLADQRLYDLILRKEIVHDGDIEIRNAFRFADVKFDEELHKRRLVKRSTDRKIDAAVALSMATDFCLYLNI